MTACATWFRADPRRLCVLGVWLHVAGVATLFTALLTGPSAPALLAGISLILLSGRTKAAGVEQFRAKRLLRRRPALAATAQPARSARAT